MSNTYVSSSSVRPSDDHPQKIRVLSYRDPEKVLVRELAQFFHETGYSSQFPNFENLRISSVHPFIQLLSAELLQVEQPKNLFPAITIADQDDSEHALTMGRDENKAPLSQSILDLIKAEVARGDLFVADSALTKLQDALNAGNAPTVTSYSYREQHTLNWNIWGDNRDIVKLLYDIVKQFVVTERPRLASEHLFDIQEEYSGHRTGDVNFDFGQVLYGANVSTRMYISYWTVNVELPWGPVPDDVIVDADYKEYGG